MTQEIAYGYDYFHGIGSNYPKKGYEYQSFDHFRKIVEFVLSVRRGEIKWLDVGCAYGFLVKYAYDAGIDAYGCDVSLYAIERGKKLLPDIAERLFVCKCEDVVKQFGKESFDVVSLIEVIEHLPKPIDGLIAAYQVLKSGGILIITTPDPDLRPIDFDKDVTHISVKSFNEWTSMLKAVGFSAKAPYFFVDPCKFSKRFLVRLLTRVKFFADLYRMFKGRQLPNDVITGILAIK
jgi:SAM-dependent methyltransferase